MDEEKTLVVRQVGEVTVMTAPTYFDKDVGAEAHRITAECFKQGARRFVLDFSRCQVANSPGTALLMDLAFKILDDYNGSFVLCALDSTKESIFTLIGILPMVPVRKTLEEAIEEASQG